MPVWRPVGMNCAVWPRRGNCDAPRLSRWLTSLDKFEERISQTTTIRRYGRLTRATGLVLEATGLQLPLGATCLIERHNGGEVQEVESEVVGFNGQHLFLMPLKMWKVSSPVPECMPESPPAARLPVNSQFLVNNQFPVNNHSPVNNYPLARVIGPGIGWQCQTA